MGKEYLLGERGGGTDVLTIDGRFYLVVRP